MRVVLVSGGGGGALLAAGLDRALPAGSLTIAANTGDDHEHYGLLVQPDVDSILYRLSDRFDAARGWGVARETFNALDTLRGLGESAWFQVGDRDLGLHLLRNQMLRDGSTLSAAVQEISRRLGLGSVVAPMSETPVRTEVHCGSAVFGLQEWLVHRHAEPRVSAVTYAGAAAASAPTTLRAAIESADLLLVGPSNPFISVLPVFAVEGVRSAWNASAAPKVAVSPVIDGSALKGPLARMLESMGHAVSAGAVAALYRGIADTFVVDQSDPAAVADVNASGLRPVVLDTVMRDVSGATRLAAQLLELSPVTA
ncbi:MAG: 2-phospho-L-lactate transferase CofD family protein [Candidatus Dormibacteria bacterium]